MQRLVRRAGILGLGILGFLGGGCCLGWAGEPAPASSAKPSISAKPNIIFILIDDLGWAELGCYGNPFHETPHVDGLARRGMRFTSAYAAAPVCSPTRASFLTGQYPVRTGITDYLRPADPKHLSLQQITLPEMLKRAGYTTGIIGKWHLTGYAHHGATEVPPTQHGFDEVICSERRGIGGGSYFWPYHFNPQIPRRLPNEYLVDRLNLEAVEFIERNKDRPFFLFLSHYAVHTRLVGKPKLVAKYEAKLEPNKDPKAHRNKIHLAAQLESIDQGVGMILQKLAELNLTEKTLIVFTSDNGGELSVTSNGPLRGGKSMLYEGGIRVPLIISYPGVVQPDSVCQTPVCTIDFYPTFLELVGIQPDPKQTLDGVSLVPLLRDPKARLPREALYWHYPLQKPHFLGGRSSSAIRFQDWKLIEFHQSGKVELFNLARDLGETKDLSAAMPERASQLRQKLHDWLRSVTPTP